MEIKIDEDNVLLCPHCGESYLHHDTVNVYSRYEDGVQTMHTEIDANFQTKTALVASSTVLNPSGRRGGLSIAFWCEICTGESTLTISQHKGRTFVNWESL